MKVAFLLSRQKQILTPGTWWLRAVDVAAEWCVRQGWILVGGTGILPLDFVGWSFRRHGGIVEEIRMEGARRERVDRRVLMRNRDREVIRRAEVLVAVAVREGGIMEEEGMEALGQGKPVFAMPTPAKTKAFGGNLKLLKSGAHSLELAMRLPAKKSAGAPSMKNKSAGVPADDPKNFLWHFTRACPGPWPGQTQEDYFLSLIRNEPDASHTGLDALIRILTERKIRASAEIIRGKFAVVCFSGEIPHKLLAKRKFRSSLARWDFEPYAVGISVAAAERLGMRPVSYLASDLYKLLQPANRPFYQRDDAGSADWKHEKEWRHVGDVDLSLIMNSEIRALVPAVECQKAVRRLPQVAVRSLEG